MINLDPPSSREPAPRVELLRWPADAGRREELAADGRPCLLLVDQGVTPPRLDRDEDWIRVPADERDVWARLQRLARRHDERRRRPRLSDGVVLDHDGRTVIVSQNEGLLLGLLIDRFGQLVRWDEIRRALWPDGSGTVKLTVARVSRLRVRITHTGLVIHTIRGRGVLLDHGTPPTASAPLGAREHSQEDTWRFW